MVNAPFKTLRDYGYDTDHKIYVIAEIGINHGGNVELAKRLIDSAAASNVDSVKFQTYLTEQRAPKGNKMIFDILKKSELPFEAFSELKAHADTKHIDFFSTAFDLESVRFLETIGCPMYKVASFDVVNRPLLKALAKTGKPVILSTGMANLSEIRQAYDILRQGTSQITLLHCVSAYPTQEDDANLAAIYTLRREFDCVVGQSDHTNGISVPLLAAAAGAQVLEKHYRIDATMDCIDAPVSITQDLMAQLMTKVRNVEKVMGDGALGMTPAQEGAKIFRRDIH